ncbi:MAG: geranylgeranyl reductase family protein, partial [Bryobacteraceae bacterium]|nr:geranylgeranyl reductase family protein [Bryobacteraceae bacterium]
MGTLSADIVVVGGGPAGSVAAAQLARQGCQVMLLDAKKFPREKACGGGIQHRCLPFLPTDFPSVTRSACTSVRLTHGLRSTHVKYAGRPVVHCVNRGEFDHYLLQTAAACGVQVREGVRVLAARPGDSAVSLDTTDGVMSARYVVAADGANSVVNQNMNPRSSFHWQTALYAEVEARRIGGSAPDPTEMRVDVNSLPSGYAWLFPKGNLVNIGAGAPNRFARLLTKYLAAFLKADGYRIDDVKWRGHQLPTMTSRTVFAKARLFAIGDAAGMVEPLTGEGISYACHSAHLVAESISSNFDSADGAEEAYIDGVNAQIRSELAWSGRIVLFSSLFPKAFCAALGSDKAWSLFFKVLTGELTFRDLERNLL